MYTASAAPFDRVRLDRDIVLLDQRGTGRSHRLDCKYDNQNVFQRIEDIEVGPENVRCRDELSKTSDLRFYTTSIAVKDLDAIRLAPGLRPHQSAGVSYGTRVAPAYARRYPKSARTLILDGVVNPEQVLGPRLRSTPRRALERILGRCKADASCAKAFGDPFADYRSLRERLARQPEPATVGDAATGRPIHFEFHRPAPVGGAALRQLQRRPGRAAAAVSAPGGSRRKLHAVANQLPRVCPARSTKPSPMACTTAWPAAKMRRSSTSARSISRH
jgi:pimeloyl-ACP methyl ester carboxylesterase